MANFCINCGAPLEDGAKFCTNCGAAREGDKISSLNGKQNSLDPKIRRMQIDRPLNNQGSGSNKNIMIGVLIGLLIILGAGCGYYYYTAQQSALEIATKTAAEKAAQEQAQKDKADADTAKAKADKTTVDSSVKDQGNRNAVYARATLSRLDSGEAALSELASKINSGTYPRNVLLRQEANLVEGIENRRSALQNEVQADASIVSRANDLFSIQIKRANCMARGIQGEQDQYRIGGNYYDQFQDQYAAFKQDTGL